MADTVKLTFIWNGDEGCVDRKCLKALVDQHPMVVLDFLQDVRAEADHLYQQALAVTRTVRADGKFIPTETPFLKSLS